MDESIKGLICPRCQDGLTKVIDSRPQRDKIRRRRECLECGFRFTTYEKFFSKNNSQSKCIKCRKPNSKLYKGLCKDCFLEEFF